MIKRIFKVIVFVPLLIATGVQMVWQILDWLFTGKSMYDQPELWLFQFMEDF